MRSMHNPNQYNYPIYDTYQNEQRFIGPVLPFLGGALVGYIAGRPNYNYVYPQYYPVYYPYYPNYYYQQPYTTYSSNYQNS